MRKQVEAEVKEILTEKPETRSNDHLLYEEYVWRHTRVAFYKAFIGYKELGLPCFESVSRARRKVQSKHPELKADAKTEQARLNEEIKYYNYYVEA